MVLFDEMAAGDPSPERLAAARAQQSRRRGLWLNRLDAYLELEALAGAASPA